jgi:tetratricopeptide (TPR) repeat protein
VAEGKIVTFYSFKGGAGRTMALANVAWILASQGLKVLVVDWDLDSPGLHRYFHPFLDPRKIVATPGVVELISDYIWAATSSEDRPGDWHLPYAEILTHAVSINWDGFPEGATLDFVSAGRQNRDYSSAVASVDWDNFYDRLGGGQFFDALRASMKQHYDYTLIDSRTGLSDIADICTVHLPDILVDCFTLNDQSIEGAAGVARSIDQRYHARNIRILPVPMRIDDAEKEKLDAGRAKARSQFPHFPRGMTDAQANAYWRSVEIPYRPFYAYEELLATFGDTPGSPLSLLGAFERLTAAITEEHVVALPEMDEGTRLQYLDAFTRPRVPPPADIYLSYITEDRMWADWIAAVLAQAGFRVRKQAGSVQAGGNEREEAARAAGAASRTIAIVSAAYLRSQQSLGVREAMAAADPAGANRRLIPVRVSEVRVSEPFAERAVLDLARKDAAQAAEEILRALGRPARPNDHYSSDPVPREPRYPRTIPPIWNVPTRNAAFTGRNDVLDRLRDQLIGSSKAVVLPLALYGYGGVGKTQVALEYAHRYMAEYDVVWWISSAQEELISPAFANLAPRLGLRVGESMAEAAQAAREALRRGTPYPRWLLIFDNADEPADLEPYFPGGPGHVLITSRNPGWSRVAEPVEVDVFARHESLEHLQRRAPSLTDDDAALVAEALGDMPLAVEQAGAWLAETGMSAAEYVSELSTQLLDLSQPSSYPTPVAVTWRLAFDRLRDQSPAAARMLQLCAFFAPEPISLSLLYSAQMIRSLIDLDERLKDRIIIGQLIRDIARYSLAKVDRGSNTIQVHRLVQAVIRAQIESEADRATARHEVHRVLVEARPRQGDTDDPGNWPRYEWIWPHLGPSMAAECEEEETRQLLIDRVRYLWQRGDFEGALALGYQLEELWREQLGPDDRQTLYLRFHLANLLRSQGRYAEALEVDTDVHRRQQWVLTVEHPHTLQTAGSIAGDLRGLGRFREALEMDQATYDRFKELLGEDEPSTLGAANNLAIDLRLTGDCYLARDLDADTLIRRQAVLGRDHPRTLHSAAMMARDMREAGDFAGSVNLLRETHMQYANVLTSDHIDTLRTAKSLAVSLRKAGALREAYDLTLDTSQRYALTFASEHPDALACQLNLAADLAALDDKAAAASIASEVHQVYKLSLGEKHPFTLAVASNMAGYQRGTGAVRDALMLAESTLRSLRGNLGDDHPYPLSCALTMANCLYDLGQFSDAEDLQRDTITRLRKTLGDSHPDTLTAQANLAVTIRAAGRTDEAIQLQRLVIEARTRALGPMARPLGEENHPSVVPFLGWVLQDGDLESQPT